MVKVLAWLVVAAGIISVAAGAFFVAQGFAKGGWLKEAMQEEKITLGLSQEAIAAGDYIDTMSELQVAGDTVRNHRHSMSASYSEALAGGQYDPTNVGQATYAQALNLENYLYLGVLSFGVVQIAEGAGAVMIVIGLALAAIGLLLVKMVND
jgi:hypothetical protein